MKDYVKSLNTGAGSLVETSEEVACVVSQIKKYRGEVEGSVCVRRRENYESGSERRDFVAKGHAFSSADDVPDAVVTCASLGTVDIQGYTSLPTLWQSWERDAKNSTQ